MVDLFDEEFNLAAFLELVLLELADFSLEDEDFFHFGAVAGFAKCEVVFHSGDDFKEFFVGFVFCLELLG